MAVNVKNAFIAKPMDAGTAFAFPAGLYPLPTSAKSALSQSILARDHGAVDEEGFAVSRNIETQKFKMFGGGTFASAQTDFEEQIKITFLEDQNVNVLETAFGSANVLSGEATDEHGSQVTIYHTDDELPLQTWIVQAIYQGRTKRYCVEFARVASVAEVKSSHKEPTKWELILDVLKGSNGKYVTEHREDDDQLAEVEYTLTISGTPTGGDYTLLVGAESTASIAHNATANNIKSAIEALDDVVSVAVTGAGGGPYTITLVARSGGLSVGAQALTGGTDPAVTVVAA